MARRTGRGREIAETRRLMTERGARELAVAIAKAGHPVKTQIHYTDSGVEWTAEITEGELTGTTATGTTQVKAVNNLAVKVQA